jgi:hypothetical protein
MQKITKYCLLGTILIMLVLSNTNSLGNYKFENKKVKNNVKSTTINGEKLVVTTDSGVYDPGELVTIYLTNVGDKTLYGCGPLITIYTEDGEIVYEEAIYSWHELEPGEYIVYTWNQTDKNGSQVPIGFYKIEGTLFGVGITFVNCTLFAVTYEDIVTHVDGKVGENGWYISCVTLTILYDPGVIMVVLVNGKNYSEPVVICDDGEDIPVEISPIDWEGNPVQPHHYIILDIDQTKPNISIVYEVDGGNIFRGWDLLFTATATDDMSGMNKVEFYINKVFEETVNGSGPTYQWVYHYPSYYALNVRGLIRNKEITCEYVKFYAIMVIISGLGKEDIPFISAYAYDNAGNYNFDEIKSPCPKETISPGIYLFKNLTLQNNYGGFIGKFFIKALFYL